jgi:DNA-binding NarL/FixJ family response regulator
MVERGSSQRSTSKPERNGGSRRNGGVPEGLSLLLIEDDELIRKSLLDWLASVLVGSHLVGGPSQEVETLASTETPEVIVVDIALCDDDGIDTIRKLETAFPATKMVALVRGGESQSCDVVLAAGADDCMLIWEVHEKLAPAVERLLGAGASGQGKGA